MKITSKEFDTHIKMLEEFEEKYTYGELKTVVDGFLQNLNTTYSTFIEKKRNEYHKCKTFKEKTKVYTHLKVLELGYQTVIKEIPKEWEVLPYSQWLSFHHSNMVEKYGFKVMVEFYTSQKETFIKTR